MATTREPNQFLAPPADVFREGRYNHAGCPVLYLSSSAAIAYAEIGKPHDGCLVADVKLKHALKILDLASQELPSDLLQAATASALLSAPAEKDGWEKPEYTFSRFVADCAVSAGFTALRYPSVANAEGFNLVLFSPSANWPEVAVVGSINEFHPAC
jgi:RES domain-containing protein